MISDWGTPINSNSVDEADWIIKVLLSSSFFLVSILFFFSAAGDSSRPDLPLSESVVVVWLWLLSWLLALLLSDFFILVAS